MSRRNTQDLEHVLAATEKFLDDVDPASLEWQDPADLRRIGAAATATARAADELNAAVATARASGRSWAEIGMVLGVSRQAAQQRFG